MADTPLSFAGQRRHPDAPSSRLSVWSKAGGRGRLSRLLTPLDSGTRLARWLRLPETHPAGQLLDRGVGPLDKLEQQDAQDPQPNLEEVDRQLGCGAGSSKAIHRRLADEVDSHQR